jgi:membrane-associated PAP2 superfamily phosphatase
MISDPVQCRPWRPDRRFWLIHLVLPLAAAAAMLTLLEHTSLDLWLADHWYALEGGAWAWRDHWLAYDVIHHHGKQMLIALGLVLLLLITLSFRVTRLREARMPMVYLLTSMAVLPAAIASSKRWSPVPCPWDLIAYGGDATYRHSFAYTFGAAQSGHCFPAGHAAGGFALLAVYFAAFLYARRPALFLLPGLIVGTVFALGQQARGAHFLSHDLWTLSLCWFGALGLFLLFRPQRWPGPVARTAPPL